MFSGSLRSIIRPVLRTTLSSQSPFIFPITSSPSPACDRHFCHLLLRPFLGNVGGIPASNAFHSASLRRAAENKAEEQLVLKQPNQASVRRRDEKKNRIIKQHRAQEQEANRREREKWDEQRIQKYWLNYLAEKKKRKEKNKEAKRNKERLEHLPKSRKYYLIRAFEEDKKNHTAVAGMSLKRWIQWKLIQKEIQSKSIWRWIQKERGAEAKLKINRIL